jgi:predicted porin
MKKKLVAIAIAAAFAPAAAMAEANNVTVYGKFVGEFESVKNDKATAKNSLNRIKSTGSRLGFKGNEDLGDGLNAIWQLETQVNITGDTGNAGTTTAPFMSMRNANVGLKGNFGTAFFGHWDSPFKAARNKIEGGIMKTENAGFGTASAILGTNGAGASAFHGRMKQSVHYVSPSMSGFTANFAYATDNQATDAKTTNTDKISWSASGVYDQGPFYGALAFQKFDDVAGNNLNDDAMRLVGVYKYGAGSVGLEYERLSDENVAGNDRQRNAWALSANYVAGASTISGFYAKAGDMNGTTNTGARQFTLRYGYNLSKRTELFGLYSNLSNDANGGYNFTGLDSENIPGAAGSKVTGFGVGIAHAF